MSCIFEPAHKKGALWFSSLWFFKCAVPYLGYRHAFLPEASSRSLLHVFEQQRLWWERLYLCTGSPEPLLVNCVISTLFSWAGLYMVASNRCSDTNSNKTKTLCIDEIMFSPPIFLVLHFHVEFVLYISSHLAVSYLPWVLQQTGLSKQCTPRSDASFCSIWSVSAWFATDLALF